MTMNEKLTLEDFNQKFDAYIEQDEKWKKEIESKLQPLVDNNNERAIIEKYFKEGFKVIMAILGLIAAIGLAYSQLHRLVER